MNPIFVTLIVTFLTLVHWSSTFAYPMDDYTPGISTQLRETLPESPTYESIMDEYSIDNEISSPGPSRLLGRLYGALTASGKTEDRLARLELAYAYDQILIGRVNLAEHEGGTFESSMPETQVYELLQSRLDSEKKALEQYPFIRNFKHDFSVSLMIGKVTNRVFDYFIRARAPGDADKVISKLELRLKKYPPKSDRALLMLFLEKELMKAYLKQEKLMQREKEESGMEVEMGE